MFDSVRIIRSMKLVRRMLAAFGAIVFAVIVAMPSAALAGLRCDQRSACPMMAKRGAPCHGPESGAARGMSAPMGCCETPATLVPAATGFPIAPAAVTAPGLEAPVAGAAIGAPDAGSWRSRRGTPELFTLHAVWRI